MPDTQRIIDANYNRAREALRVMEDYARFILDDATLARAIKETRHELRVSVPDALHLDLVRSRDIVGDVGREVSTELEGLRETPTDVVIAAGKRLSEALRTMEEFGKTTAIAPAVTWERLRYRGYELERRLMITMSARARLGSVRLYVLITEDLCCGEWLAVSASALRGGANCLQLREKHLADAELLRRATRLTALCHEHGALCIINDRVDIARLSGADGVHLGQDDVSVVQARRVLPAGSVIGASTHTSEQIDAGIATGADYLAVGPMFPSRTKPQNHVAGPGMLRTARARTGLPLVAIGGITRDNAGAVLASADCCSLCVCSAVIGASDPESACRELVQVIETSARSATPDK